MCNPNLNHSIFLNHGDGFICSGLEIACFKFLQLPQYNEVEWKSQHWKIQ